MGIAQQNPHNNENPVMKATTPVAFWFEPTLNIFLTHSSFGNPFSKLPVNENKGLKQTLEQPNLNSRFFKNVK